MMMTVTYDESIEEYTFIRKAYKENSHEIYSMTIEGQKLHIVSLVMAISKLFLRNRFMRQQDVDAVLKVQ